MYFIKKIKPTNKNIITKYNQLFLFPIHKRTTIKLTIP